MALLNNPLVRKLAAYMSLSEAEISILDALYHRRRPFATGSDLIHEGQTQPPTFILFKGWAQSCKVLPCGRRQILNFHVPGDILGMRCLVLKAADHTIGAISKTEAAEFKLQDAENTFQTYPRLTAAVRWAASSEEAILAERLLSLGRRDATERIAHFFLELDVRLRRIGLARADSYECPLTQYHLADALGLSPVHVNRVLRQLRDEDLMTFRNNIVTFNNLDHLVELAGFDATYLDFEGRKSSDAFNRTAYSIGDHIRN